MNSERLNVVGSVGASGKVGQVELDLVPSVVESHGHRANERLDASRALVVARSESPAHVLVVENLHFEGEVFL